jgi:hypothetical protein
MRDLSLYFTAVKLTFLLLHLMRRVQVRVTCDGLLNHLLNVVHIFESASEQLLSVVRHNNAVFCLLELGGNTIVSVRVSQLRQVSPSRGFRQVSQFLIDHLLYSRLIQRDLAAINLLLKVPQLHLTLLQYIASVSLFVAESPGITTIRDFLPRRGIGQQHVLLRLRVQTPLCEVLRHHGVPLARRDVLRHS